MWIRLYLIITFTVSTLLFNHSSAAQQQINKLRGIDLTSTVFFEVVLPTSTYSDPQQRRRFVRQALKSIKTIPRMESAAVADTLPFSNSHESRTLYINGATPRTGTLTVHYNAITPDYFRTVRLPLFKGRVFTEKDRPGSPGVIILSEGVARKLCPNEDPIGQHISFSNTSEQDSWLEVIGVVGNVQDSSDQLRAEIYVEYIQNPALTLSILVRCTSQSKEFVEKLREEIQALDSQAVIAEIKD